MSLKSIPSYENNDLSEIVKDLYYQGPYHFVKGKL